MRKVRLPISYHPFDANLVVFCTRIGITNKSGLTCVLFGGVYHQVFEYLIIYKLMYYVLKFLLFVLEHSHESLEQGRNSYEDETLSGMLKLCAAVVRQNPSFKDSEKSLVRFYLNLELVYSSPA